MKLFDPSYKIVLLIPNGYPPLLMLASVLNPGALYCYHSSTRKSLAIPIFFFVFVNPFETFVALVVAAFQGQPQNSSLGSEEDYPECLAGEFVQFSAVMCWQMFNNWF